MDHSRVDRHKCLDGQIGRALDLRLEEGLLQGFLFNLAGGCFILDQILQKIEMFLAEDPIFVNTNAA